MTTVGEYMGLSSLNIRFFCVPSIDGRDYGILDTYHCRANSSSCFFSRNNRLTVGFSVMGLMISIPHTKSYLTA